MAESSRVAVVTGGASGIGAAVVTRLCAERYRVVIADLDSEAGARVADAVPDGVNRPWVLRTDVSVEDDVAALMAAVMDRFGRIDVLHNNAAALSREVIGADADAVSTPAAVWQRTFEVDLFGAVLCIRHALPHMQDRRAGSIINTSSVLSLRGDLARTAYSAAKAALNTLTLSVATQAGPYGVRCNAVVPGTILGEKTRRKLSENDVSAIVAGQLLPRTGEPADIAGAVAFLAGDDAAFITGQLLVVDGGYVAHVPALAGLASNGGESR